MPIFQKGFRINQEAIPFVRLTATGPCGASHTASLPDDGKIDEARKKVETDLRAVCGGLSSCTCGNIKCTSVETTGFRFTATGTNGQSGTTLEHLAPSRELGRAGIHELIDQHYETQSQPATA